ncbi:MAG: hypothetical protein LBH46_00775, partial [Rickettsiales bacterium]|nr:hypothetical protein [Rickettsiales bacterium]
MELLKKLSYIKSYNNIHDIYKTRDARVICFYLNLQSMNGKDFEISLKNICKGLKMCKQTVINSNNYLLENGLIDIKNDGEPTSINTYTVNVEKVLSFVPIKKERKKRVVVDGPKKEFLEATEQQDDTNEVILSEEPSEPSEEAKKEILSPQLQKLMEENKNRVKDEDEDIENIEVVEEKEEDKTKNNILSNNLKKIIGNLKVVDDEQPTTCEVLSIENTHPVEQPDSKEIEIIPTKEESNEVVEVYQDDEKENNEVIEQHQDDEKEKGYNNIVEKDGVVVVQSRHIDISEEKPRARKATKYTNEKIDWSI